MFIFLLSDLKVLAVKTSVFFVRKIVQRVTEVNGYPLTGRDAPFLPLLFVPFLCLLPLLLYHPSW